MSLRERDRIRVSSRGLRHSSSTVTGGWNLHHHHPPCQYSDEADGAFAADPMGSST